MRVRPPPSSQPPSEAPTIKSVGVETREFVIVDMLRDGDQFHFQSKEGLKGAIVWLRTGRHSTPVQIVEGAGFLKQQGAVRVVVLPGPFEDALIPHDSVAADVTPNANVRDVIAELVDELDDDLKEDVRKTIETALAEVGL